MCVLGDEAGASQNEDGSLENDAVFTIGQETADARASGCPWK